MATNIKNKEIQVQKPAQSLQAFQAKIAASQGAEEISTGLLKPILISVGAVINSALEISFTIGWRTAMAEDSGLQHRAVYEMIAARDAEGAFYAMRKLLRNSKGNVLDALRASRGRQEPH